MKRTFCILIACVIKLIAFAQTPGYMGKKLLVGGAFSFGSPDFTREDPATLNSVFDSASYRYKPAFHGHAKISIDYVISEKQSINLALKKSRMGFRHINYYPFNTQEYVTELDFNSIDIGLRMHSLGNIAPLGFFFYAGIGLNSATERDKAGNSLKDTITLFKETKSRFGSLNLSVGHHVLIGKYLILSPQLEINIINLYPVLRNDDEYKYQIAMRWQKSAWFNLGIGLSYLIF